MICYTGGSTGLPKGAILTHGNVTWNSINTVVSWGLDQNDTPGVGVFERANACAYFAWIVVLAITLIRRCLGPSRTPTTHRLRVR